MVLLGYVDVVVALFELDAQAFELRRDDAQIVVRYVLDGQFRTVHGRHADEAAHFDHVGQQRMLRAAQQVDALDGQQVRGDARNAGSHAVEHPAELLDIGFARGVVDRRRAPCHDSRHADVGRSRHRRLVQQHVGAFQMASFDREEFFRRIEIELGAQFLKPEEVGVEPAAADFVAAGFGYVAHTEARQHPGRAKIPGQAAARATAAGIPPRRRSFRLPD